MQTAAMPYGFGKHLRLPQALRERLRRPLGTVLSGSAFREAVQACPLLITVGDYCTAEALAAEVLPRVALVDLKIERRADDRLQGFLASPSVHVVEVVNPPAQISVASWDALQRALQRLETTVLRVQGEEDLLALPAIALAPAGATVAYGQPGEGAVLVTVDDPARARVAEILRQMEVVHGD